jgi:hypothetical protein
MPSHGRNDLASAICEAFWTFSVWDEPQNNEATIFGWFSMRG